MVQTITRTMVAILARITHNQGARRVGFLPWVLVFGLAASACSSEPGSSIHVGGGAGTASAGAGMTGTGQPTGGGAGASVGGTITGPGGSTPLPTMLVVHLVPQVGVSGSQRVNFAVPLAPGQLSDETLVRVLSGGVEVSAFRRGLARHGDGSLRSVQLQLQQTFAAQIDIEVRLGEKPATAALEPVPVPDTLVTPTGESGPRVWALLPAEWLSATGFAGPLVPEVAVAAQPSAAWARLCDYDANDTAAFLDSGYETDRAVWLFDRGTALYRGYARRGDLGPLQSAYIETSIYRNRITGSGEQARNGVAADAAEDVKYTYTQNLALHYLLSGDDRFRESAEDLALGMSKLWPSPGYAGGEDFWTERHAGFSLLAYVWAMIVSDDRSPEFRALADAAVSAYLEIQASYPPGHTDQTARCFAHTADAHGEGGAYFGCSPWMSAILADGLAEYATESSTDRATLVREGLVKLGRIIAKTGIQADGRPLYFMGVDTDQGMLEEYDEHYGESAYLIGMSWYFSGKTDASLRTAADQLVNKLGSDGTAPHLRSFNWQCRSAVQAPWYLQ
jgi:hypothetical protein